MKHLYQITIGILIGLCAAGLILIVSKPSSGEPITLIPAPTATETSQPKPTQTETPLYVQIKGEINRPGIYSLPNDARLEDLVSKAGGVTAEADNNRINLALILHDGDYIFIPAEGQEIPEVARNAPDNSVKDQGNNINYPININDANQDELESLPGIGPAKAADIIAYREMIGSFSSLEDLLEISGIGTATLESLREYLICELCP
jgi:competence protein ComEA